MVTNAQLPSAVSTPGRRSMVLAVSAVVETMACWSLVLGVCELLASPHLHPLCLRFLLFMGTDMYPKCYLT